MGAPIGSMHPSPIRTDMPCGCGCGCTCVCEFFFFFLSLIRSETERKKKQGPNWSDSVQNGLKEINKMKTMHSPVSRWPVASTGSNKQMKKNKRVEEEETEEVYGVRYFVEYVVENGD